MSRCSKVDLKATVEQSESTIIITPIPRVMGCDEVRYIIKADGTGGIREVKNGDNWVPDGIDRKLTIRN